MAQQLTTLSSERELGGLLKYLTPAVDNTAVAVKRHDAADQRGQRRSRNASRKVLVPTGNEKITVDSSPPTGPQVYQQLFQSAVGLASATQNFDGNGHYLRATVGGGADQIQTQPLADAGALYGNAVLPVHRHASRRSRRRQAAPTLEVERALLHADRPRTSTARPRGPGREARDQDAHA